MPQPTGPLPHSDRSHQTPFDYAQGSVFGLAQHIPLAERSRSHNPPSIATEHCKISPMKSKDLLSLMAKQKRDSKSSSKATDRVVYSEFGTSADATARPTPDLPPNQQDLRVQVSRKGRKGKSVTIISGFTHNSETLGALAKKLKAGCGSGGTVRDNTIEIQGEHGPKLVSLLIEKGYKAKISGG